MANQYECTCPKMHSAGKPGLCPIHDASYIDKQKARDELSAIKGAQAGEAEPGCTKPGCFPYCDCDSIDSPPNPPASGAVPEQEPEKGLEIAARFLEKRAQNYDEEHGCTDPETGTREYPGDGAEYYHELMEMAEELRALLAKAKP